MIWNRSKLQKVDSFNYDDGSEKSGKDTFEREPFVVRFKTMVRLILQAIIVQLLILEIESANP